MKNRKGARNIIVDMVHYRWRATGNDGYISITIWPDALPGPTINAAISYHERIGDYEITDKGGLHCPLGAQIVVTNRIIRRVILMCISKHQYNPTVKGKALSRVKCDALIDVSDAIRADRKDG